MMVQWQACKDAAKDAVLFFRMGDFYEAFHDDAVLISKELDLTLTRRQEIPMSGVPYHTSEAYIDKLVGKGYCVAIAEQTEDPKKAKGLVNRAVVRIVTPGSLINSSLLSDKKNNFLASITRVGSFFGVAFIDLTTAEFRVIEFDKEHELLNELYRIRPAEFLTSPKFKEKHQQLFQGIRHSFEFCLSTHDDWHFDHQVAHDFLVNQLKVHSLDGFGLKGMVAGINAAGALLHYIQEVLCLSTCHVQEIHTYSISQYMSLDRATQCNLELTESLKDKSRKNTLLSILDKTQTPMGARLMQRWVKQPLLSVEKITKRQEAIQTLLSQPSAMNHLGELLAGVRDIERLMMRVSSGYASPRDLVALRFSFEPIQTIKEALEPFTSHSVLLFEEEEGLDGLPIMTSLIAAALVDEPPIRLSEGKIFRSGYHRELDELREICVDSKSWIANYQKKCPTPFNEDKR